MKNVEFSAIIIIIDGKKSTKYIYVDGIALDIERLLMTPHVRQYPTHYHIKYAIDILCIVLHIH